MDDDEVAEFSVQDLAQIPQHVRHLLPVTFAIGAQLAEMTDDESPFEEFETLATAVITTVYNLELKLLNTRTDLLDARANAIQTVTSARVVYAKLLDLETRLVKSGVRLSPSQYGSPEFPDI